MGLSPINRVRFLLYDIRKLDLRGLEGLPQPNEGILYTHDAVGQQTPRRALSEPYVQRDEEVRGSHLKTKEEPDVATVVI